MSEFGLDTVNVSFLKGAYNGKIPILGPRWDASMEFLVEFLKSNRPWVDEMITGYGAVLVRGFDMDSAPDMEAALMAFQPRLNSTYRGTSKRATYDGTEYIFSAADAPSNFPIAQHIEMSFLPAPPTQIYFGCLVPPKSSGGETALADFRRVFQDIPQDLKQKLMDTGILYTRTHKKKGSYLTYDIADMLGWPQLFGTDSKEQVEDICRREGMPCEWDGDTFVSKFHTAAYQLHPITKEHVWFNHSQVFHWTTFPCELWYAFCRTREWRLLFQMILVGTFCLIKYGLLGYKMSLHCQFGNGEDISVSEMRAIRAAIHNNIVFSRWEKGDLMMIDNFSTSHGRQPTYDKGRKIAVAWSDPFVKTNEVVSLDPVMPFSMENPQERTPESKKTKSDSTILQGMVKTKSCYIQLS
jgi:hypothetical protein